MDDPLSVVLPEGHRLAGREALDLAELADERWVLGCLKTETFLRRYAAVAGFELRVAGSTTDYFFARSLVAAGVGVSLVPYVALDPALPGTLVVPVTAPRPARHFGIARARGRRLPPYAETLARLLREQVAPGGERAARADRRAAPARFRIRLKSLVRPATYPQVKSWIGPSGAAPALVTLLS